MAYIDGFVASARDRDAYHNFVSGVAALVKEHGAARVVEAWGDDVPRGERTDLYRAVAAEDGETVVFSWIEWPDKAIRDAGWEKIMADQRMQSDDAPFDMKRMIFGGFEIIVDQ